MAWLADGACVELARLWGRNGKWDDDDDDDDDDDGGDDNGGDDGWTARRFGKQMFLSVDVAGGFMSGEQGLLGAERALVSTLKELEGEIAGVGAAGAGAGTDTVA